MSGKEQERATQRVGPEQVLGPFQLDTQNRQTQTEFEERRRYLDRRMNVAIGNEPVGGISNGFLQRPERDAQLADRLC